MRIQVDKRVVEITEDPALLADLERLIRTRRELDLEIGAALVAAEGKRAYVAEEAASLPEICRRYGLEPTDTWRLYRLGRAVEVFPNLRQKVHKGDVPLGNASQIGRIACSPELMREGDDWVALAEQGSRNAVRRAVVERIEEVAQRELVVPIGLCVTRTALERFRRVREIASRKAGRMLTEGETFDVANTYYLDGNDETRKKPRKRRMGETSGNPSKRTVPAEVKRQLEHRSDGCCEVPGCTNRVFRQRAHRTPNRDGGGQEIDEQFSLCWTHHLLYDAGRLAFAGWTEDGRPTFETSSGRILRPRGTRPRPGEGKGRRASPG